MTFRQQNLLNLSNDHRVWLSGSLYSLHIGTWSAPDIVSPPTKTSQSQQRPESCRRAICMQSLWEPGQAPTMHGGPQTRHLQSQQRPRSFVVRQSACTPLSLSKNHRALLSGSQHAHPSVSTKTTELCRQAVCSLQ